MSFSSFRPEHSRTLSGQDNGLSRPCWGLPHSTTLYSYVLSGIRLCAMHITFRLRWIAIAESDSSGKCVNYQFSPFCYTIPMPLCHHSSAVSKTDFLPCSGPCLYVEPDLWALCRKAYIMSHEPSSNTSFVPSTVINILHCPPDSPIVRDVPFLYCSCITEEPLHQRFPHQRAVNRDAGTVWVIVSKFIHNIDEIFTQVLAGDRYHSLWREGSPKRASFSRVWLYPDIRQILTKATTALFPDVLRR